MSVEAKRTSRNQDTIDARIEELLQEEPGVFNDNARDSGLAADADGAGDSRVSLVRPNRCHPSPASESASPQSWGSPDRLDVDGLSEKGWGRVPRIMQAGPVVGGTWPGPSAHEQHSADTTSPSQTEVLASAE